MSVSARVPSPESTAGLDSKRSSGADLGSFSWNHRPSSDVDQNAQCDVGPEELH